MGPASRVTVSLALMGTCVASSASADPLRASAVNWVVLPGAENCGPTEVLTRAVEIRLQRAPFVAPEDANVSIDARAERAGDSGHWRATVRVADLSGTIVGTREFESAAPDCAELRDSVALAIALMIDPDALLHALVTAEPAPAAPAERSSAEPSRERTATPPPERAPEPAPPPVPSRTPWLVSPTASVALGVGPLPSPAVGLIADVGVKPPHFWGVDVVGGFWVSQTESAVDGATTDFSLAFGGLAVCPANAPSDRPGFAICGGASVGALTSAGHGFSTSQTRTGVLADVLVSAALRIPLAGPLAFQLRADIGLTAFRDEYRYFDAENQSHKVFEPAAASASLAAGLSMNIPRRFSP